MKVKSSPDLRRSAFTSFAPKLSTLSQALKFVRTMRKISSELLNCHDKELTLYNVVEIRKQSALEDAEEPEPDP
jgi:hypothetical protein